MLYFLLPDDLLLLQTDSDMNAEDERGRKLRAYDLLCLFLASFYQTKVVVIFSLVFSFIPLLYQRANESHVC